MCNICENLKNSKYNEYFHIIECSENEGILCNNFEKFDLFEFIEYLQNLNCYMECEIFENFENYLQIFYFDKYQFFTIKKM